MSHHCINDANAAALAEHKHRQLNTQTLALVTANWYWLWSLLASRTFLGIMAGFWENLGMSPWILLMMLLVTIVVNVVI